MTRKHFKRLVSRKNQGLNGYAYDFSVDYDTTNVDDIKNVQKYLMEKNDSVNEDIQIC